ncbi:tyrosine-type recombinase/integrase [Rhodobacteraceae bacterium R_SAG6]|nr:tyrosine-type recombinase/integrase [Rhodobacteraceae bacterium R_SAG6]
MKPSSRLPHLEYRRSGFYWRRRIPKRGSIYQTKPFFVFSLRTHLPSDARVLSVRLTELTTLAFQFVKGRPDMDDATLAVMVTELINFEIEAFEQSRAIADPRSLEAARYETSREVALQEVLREAVFLRNWEVARAPLKGVAQRLGLKLPEDPHDWRRLASQATLALLEVSQERQRRDRGEYSKPSLFFRRAMAATPVETRKPEPIQQPAPAIPPATFACSEPSQNTTTYEKAPVTDEAPKPGAAPAKAEEVEVVSKDVIVDDQAPSSSRCPASAEPDLAKSPIAAGGALYREARQAGKPGKKVKEKANEKKGKSYKANSLYNLNSTIRLLESFLANTAMCDLTEDDFIEFFELVQRLPALHAKSSKETRDIRKLVKQVDAEEAERISKLKLEMAMRGESKGNIEVALHRAKTPRLRVNTVYRHMQDTQRIIRFMMAHKAMNENLMSDVIWTSDELKYSRLLEEDNTRQPWDEMLPKLFRTPVFQGETASIDDPLFWAPLISVHTGMRAEEALQLLTDDIRETNGVVYFDIKVGPGQSLKSEAATRKIPVHKNLIALGFLDFVEYQRRNGEARLFPHLRRGKNREALSEVFTKAFTKYRRNNDVYDKQRDFHSFRTQFNQELMRARTDSEVRHILLGHELNDVNLEFYGGDGHPLGYLQEVVNSVQIDISMIQSPMKKAENAQVTSLGAARARLSVV